MKKSLKEVIRLFAISAVTIIAGFAVTAISFNLFDYFSRNQMRLLFALDVIIMLIIGSIAYLAECRRSERVRREQELRKRHNERIISHAVEYGEINNIIERVNNVA